MRDFLESCARYELQIEHVSPRQKVLDAIEDLGATVGVEYGTDVVEELD